ncbi:hypothetical protein [Jiella sonneratiae]|uniref:Uncharacterized protein n=1 Tax=Jiella sonneratiae TaxID=2816856 RepID=A0ABS3J3S1_9HYPH|nr:hypothetical protein [Jiella sonneratiae]MBO0903623.1 hypothetical protein [Jiella sonneratiae]
MTIGLRPTTIYSLKSLTSDEFGFESLTLRLRIGYGGYGVGPPQRQMTAMPGDAPPPLEQGVTSVSRHPA